MSFYVICYYNVYLTKTFWGKNNLANRTRMARHLGKFCATSWVLKRRYDSPETKTMRSPMLQNTQKYSTAQQSLLTYVTTRRNGSLAIEREGNAAVTTSRSTSRGDGVCYEGEWTKNMCFCLAEWSLLRQIRLQLTAREKSVEGEVCLTALAGRLKQPSRTTSPQSTEYAVSWTKKINRSARKKYINCS